MNTAEVKRFIFSIYPFEKFDWENDWKELVDLKIEPKETEIFIIFIASSTIIPVIKIKEDLSSSVKSKEECLNIYRNFRI